MTRSTPPFAPKPYLTRSRRCGSFVALIALTLTIAMVGCSQGPPPTLDTAYGALQAGQLEMAYDQAVYVAKQTNSPDSGEAAYLAGRAARQLENPRAAAVWLTRAAQSSDPAINGEAAVALGTLYAEEGKHQRASDSFLYAAERLSGEDRAKATYFAALSQQKLGQWAAARTNLILARTYTRDGTLRDRAEQQLEVTGYTVQTGAFLDADNAREAAESIAPKAAELGLGAPRLVSATADGRAVTLVHVGRFTSYNSASVFREKLDVEGVIAPIAPEVAEE